MSRPGADSVLPEGVSVAELRAHYASVRRRLWRGAEKPRVVPEPVPEEPKPKAKPKPIAEHFCLVVNRPSLAASEIQSSRGLWRDIVYDVAEWYGVTYEDIIGHGRTPYIVAARHCAIYLIKTAPGCKHLSSPAIGRLIGDRDHTTILHAIQSHSASSGLPMPEGGSYYSRIAGR